MKTRITHIALAAACLLAGPAQAAVTASFDTGSAVPNATHTADFAANTTLSNNYVENGLLLSWFGTEGDNAGCGYAGSDCYDTISQLTAAFSGNYMATNGTGAYVSVKMANGSDFQAIEFAVGSGYTGLSNQFPLYGYWQTFSDGAQTGAGNFMRSVATVLGLADAAGIDEVRFFAFNAANRQAGFSAPAFDTIRVSAISPVPEPATVTMLAAGLLGMAAWRRRAR